MSKFFAHNLLWKDGRPIALFILVSTVIGWLLFKPLLIFTLPFFIFSLYFFRNPTRLCPEYFNNKSVIISPADGRVVDVSQGNFDGFDQKVSIFLSPFDVHVNWIAQSGIVEDIIYRPGKFVIAYAPKSSEINERNDIIINGEKGQILVRQIAGIVARRICCWIEKSSKVEAGQKYGMIRFGSRVDILMPKDIIISVKCGDRLEGGRSVLGKWK